MWVCVFTCFLRICIGFVNSEFGAFVFADDGVLGFFFFRRVRVCKAGADFYGSAFCLAKILNGIDWLGF